MTKSYFCPSKKGVVFGVAFLVAAIFLLGYAFFRVYVQDNKFYDQHLGQNQLAVFNTINEAEKALLYLDAAASYAYQRAYADIAFHGGYPSISCGVYRGISVWVNQGTVCTPSLDHDLNLELNHQLDTYATYYPEFRLPMQNYEFFFNGEKWIGAAHDPLEFDINLFDTFVYEAPYSVDTYAVPKNAQQKVEFIYTQYKGFIEQASLESGVEIPWIVAIIAQESNGNPQVTSKMGARGLMQLLDETAQRMARRLDIPSGYNLYDPQTNIRLGTRYIKEIIASELVKEDGVVDERHIPAAYNGGTCNKARTRGALCPSNSCVGKRFWECEHNSGYAETRSYVPAVVAFKKAFQDWQLEIQTQGTS